MTNLKKIDVKKLKDLIEFINNKKIYYRTKSIEKNKFILTHIEIRTLKEYNEKLDLTSVFYAVYLHELKDKYHCYIYSGECKDKLEYFIHSPDFLGILNQAQSAFKILAFPKLTNDTLKKEKGDKNYE